ncbi:MAG: hypothetical protein QM758_14365 [Armatimonas sp.]
MPFILPNIPGYGTFTPNDFFLCPNICLDIIPSGQNGIMALPMRPICFPKENLFWLGPEFGGRIGETYKNQHSQLLQLEYLYDSAILMLLKNNEYEFFYKNGFK